MKKWIKNKWVWAGVVIVIVIAWQSGVFAPEVVTETTS